MKGAGLLMNLKRYDDAFIYAQTNSGELRTGR